MRWGELSESIQYGYNAPAKETGRIKMVRISDIQEGRVLWDSVPYCDIEEESINSYLIESNDILFARTGGTVGKSYLVKTVPEESIYAGYLIRTRYSKNLCPEYMKFFMDSQLYWNQLRGGTIATAQPNCNGKAAEDTPDNSTTPGSADVETERDTEGAIVQDDIKNDANDAADESNDIASEDKIKNEQLNSFSMMYYLAITAEKIRISKDNRLMLDDIYTSLLNDINPGAIDEITQDHLKNLRDIIKAYRGITVKRERLQYIYNQDKAAAIRSAVPNPLAILSVASSFDWKRLAVTVVYTAVDSYNNYKNASENADKAFLMSGWELDDEETATVQKNRDRAFDYMVDMVQEYNLDGLLTLNEKAVEKYAEICAIESAPEKIRRLVSEEETYKLLGNYWLELADCYFETNKYEKCLECVSKYNELATGIYRKDYDYVQILPKAIVAAQSVYSGDQYVSNIKEYADALMKNTSTEDWSLRYFVAQVYLDLYARTNNQAYIDSAYKIAYDNVTILLKGQRSLNNTYLKDVQEVKIEEPDYKYIPDINQLSFVSNGIMVLICLYLMTKDQGSFCCTEAKLDQIAVVCNTESVVIRS